MLSGCEFVVNFGSKLDGSWVLIVARLDTERGRRRGAPSTKNGNITRINGQMPVGLTQKRIAYPKVEITVFDKHMNHNAACITPLAISMRQFLLILIKVRIIAAA